MMPQQDPRKPQQGPKIPQAALQQGNQPGANFTGAEQAIRQQQAPNQPQSGPQMGDSANASMGGAIDWQARAKNVYGRQQQSAQPQQSPLGLSPDQAFSEGQNFGKQVKQAVNADTQMNTAVYEALSGSKTARLGSGTLEEDTPDGGGAAACGGGGGGGGGGGKGMLGLYGLAVCSIAYNHGLISEEIIKADYNQIDRFDQDTRKGYLAWAMPLARWLNVRPLLFKYSFAPFAVAWAKHMAFLDGVLPYDNWLGKTMETIGQPICKFLGKTLFRKHKDLS